MYQEFRVEQLRGVLRNFDLISARSMALSSLLPGLSHSDSEFPNNPAPTSVFVTAEGFAWRSILSFVNRFDSSTNCLIIKMLQQQR